MGTGTLADGDNFAKVEFTFDSGQAEMLTIIYLSFIEDIGNIDSQLLTEFVGSIMVG